MSNIFIYFFYLLPLGKEEKNLGFGKGNGGCRKSLKPNDEFHKFKS
jgi:hypothetical protein